MNQQKASLMKKIILVFFAAMAIIPGQSSAQVTNLKIGSVSNTIIRAIDDSTQLIYTEVSQTESYFVLYHDGDAFALAFRLPVPLQVFDVRISNGNAYFCGTVYTYALPKGLVGMFKISSVFSGASSVNYGIVWPIVCSNNDTVNILRLNRLDLFADGGNTCMAMVGDAESNGMAIHPVVSAYLTGGVWHFWSDSQKDYPIFTDIVCLDHLIVAAGTFYDDSLCFVKTFRHTRDFPAQELNPGNIHYFTYGDAKGKVLIAKDAVDTAVLAHFDVSSRVSTVLQRTPFDASTGSPVNPCLAKVTAPSSAIPYGSGQDMHDLTVVDGDVYLLHNIAYPSSPDPTNIRAWRLKTQFSSPTIEAWSPSMGKQHSMDVTYGLRVSSGSTFSYLLMHGPVWPPMSNGCQLYHTIEPLDVSVDFKEKAFVIFPGNNTSNNIAIPPTIFKVNAEKICNN